MRLTFKTPGHRKVKVLLTKKAGAKRRAMRHRKPRRKLRLTATVKLTPAKPASGAAKKIAGPTKIRTRLTFK